MNNTTNNCCVCLKNFLVLNKLSQKDESNLTFLSKLVLSIPEVEWIEKYFLCDACSDLLNIVYNFRETCLKSDLIRRQQRTEQGRNKAADVNDEIKIEYNDLVNIHEDICNESSNTSDNEQLDFNLKAERVKGKKNIKSTRRRKLRFDCERCTEQFSSRIGLVKHCIEIHDMEQKDVKPFGCTKCSSRFGTPSNLMQHMKYHEAVRCNVCSYCGKGFITNADLKIHEKQHLNKREYTCSTCVKSFNTHKDLRSHKLVVHTDSSLWKYLCEHCDKRFPIKSNYDCHMRRHTGEKNFECHLCNRRFTDKCVLQRHMRTHSNIREFKCNVCGKEYKDKRVMQIHMAKIHGIGVGKIKLPSKEKKYICHMCPKAYYAKNKLARHLYMHTGEKPFFCTVCNKKFNDQSYVKQHMKKTHNIDKVSSNSI